MQYQPLVSIVIPVFNGANYVQSAIESALAQTYKHIEIIVVNDGSEDDTDAIVSSYGDKLSYFKKENGGVASALNLAIRNSNGDYISWLSHDDVYWPKKVERQIQELESMQNPSKTIIYSDYEVTNLFNNESHIVEIGAEIQDLTDTIGVLKVLFSAVLHGCTLLVPRRAFKEVGFFDEQLKTTQDYNMWFMLLNEGYNYRHIKEPLLTSRVHEEQGTVKNNELCRAEIKNLFSYAIKLFHENIVKCPDNDFKIIVNNIGKFSLSKEIFYIKKNRIIWKINKFINTFI